MEYTFTLTFKLSAQDADETLIMTRLGEAGCTDALVGLGMAGQVGLEFIREAASAQAAILSALAEVKQALPSARLIEASPDFVGLTDVADLVGISRQAMRKLMLNHAENFPSPVHAGSTVVWHLAQLLQFMGESEYTFPTTVRDVAWAAMQVNLTKEHALLDHRVEDQISPYLLS